MKYIVFGSGGFAKELIGYIEDDSHEVVAVVSRSPFNDEQYNQKYKVITSIAPGDFPDASFLLGVGEVDIKKRIVAENENRWVNFIHSSCTISKFAKIGIGNIFCPHSNVAGDAVIGDFGTFNFYVIIAHDNVIGDYVTFSPYSGSMGICKIDDECFLGTATYCIPKIKLGKRIKVSAGSVVRHSYEQECILQGNPAKPR